MLRSLEVDSPNRRPSPLNRGMMEIRRSSHTAPPLSTATHTYGVGGTVESANDKHSSSSSRTRQRKGSKLLTTLFSVADAPPPQQARTPSDHRLVDDDDSLQDVEDMTVVSVHDPEHLLIKSPTHMMS